MKKFHIAFFIFLLCCSERRIAISCADLDKETDPEFCEAFNNAMLSFQESDEVTINSRTNSMIFLEAVTGITSRANDLHHPFYESSTVLKEDLEMWREWFIKNNQYWTKIKSDSVMLVFSGDK